MSALVLAMISHISSAYSASLPAVKSSHQSLDTAEPSGLKSFTYGALGLAAPKAEVSFDGTAASKIPEPSADDVDDVKSSNDTYYSAGQILKAAATVGSVIALFV
ncbi:MULTISPECIES: hypothetical protein [unclassified Shewanella]|uniref:hypothetical protein n=1 Tax=Shewanella TaxID=22 RepID=UPI003986BBF5